MAGDAGYRPGDRVSFYGSGETIEGTVLDVDGDILHLHTDEGKVVKHRADLPLVNKTSNFEQDERVSFPGGEGTIIKVDRREGQSDLLHVHTETGEYKQIPADKEGVEALANIQDKIVTGNFDTGTRFELIYRATELDLAYRSDRFVSLEGNRIDVAPHQVDAAYEILTSHDQRYLIADEVGLGKTIEAGIVIEELMARNRAERVLIVTPASLKMQWVEEMEEKFDQEYVIYDRNLVSSIRGPTGVDNVWEKRDMIVTSIDFAKRDDVLEPLREAEWDIVVIDEAHHLTCRRGSDGGRDPTGRYRVGEAVAQNTNALLLLTGTPHKGKHDQFFFMISLLDPYRFPSEDEITPEKLEDLMIRRLKSNPNMVHSDGTPMFPEKNIDTIPVKFTPEEEALYEDITKYLRNEYRLGEEQESRAAGFSLVIYQKRLVSSIRAIQKSLERRAKTLRRGESDARLSQATSSLLDRYRERPDTLTDKQREKVERELETLGGEQSADDRTTELNKVEDLIDRAKGIHVDSKAEKLRDSLDALLESTPDEKVLVFTEYRDTLEYLRDEVLSDLRTCQLHGQMPQSTRREEVEKFRGEANVMIATDAAREGINLQFAHIMVNYDLPWNPIRIDQRMGRLHRYGQKNPVSIYNFYLEDSRESEILNTLATKVDRIEKDLGMSSDVLGMILDDTDFNLEERIMQAVERDEPGERVVDEIEEIIEERKEAVQTIHDNFLIRDQFGDSDLEEVQEVIEESREEHVGQRHVREMVENLFSELDGHIELREDYRGEGNVYSLTVPAALEVSYDDVSGSYSGATFDREVAREDHSLEFVSVNHPLVRAAVDYCLDDDWIDGRTAVRIAEGSAPTPGIWATYRVGYEVADGSEEEEYLENVYVDFYEEIVEEPPAWEEYLDPGQTGDNSEVKSVTEEIGALLETAETEAKVAQEELISEAERSRSEVVDIKREHAKRHYDNAIETWEARLETRQQRLDEGERMEGLISIAESELEELREERERELERLKEEETVYPKPVELVSVAIGASGME